MKAKRILWSAVFVLGVAASSLPAVAMTGTEVLDKMNADERSGYLLGNIDMAAQLTYHAGNHERSNCIFDWYYKNGGIRQVLQAIERFRDRQVQPVIHALINRACGE